MSVRARRILVVFALAVCTSVAAATMASTGSAHSLSCNNPLVFTNYSGSGSQVSGTADGNSIYCTYYAALENNSGLGWSGPFDQASGSGAVTTPTYTMSCGYNIYYAGVGKLSGGSWSRANAVTC